MTKSSTLAIKHPRDEDAAWIDLPTDLRNHVRAWISAFKEVEFQKPIGDYFHALARYVGTSPGTAKRYYYTYKQTKSWKALVPKNKLPKPALDCRTNNREFRAYLLELVEAHQRCNKPAFDKLRENWRSRRSIPGYEDLPGYPVRPKGWSNRNLAHIVKSETTKIKLASIRLGVSSKTNPQLPQVFTTRRDLYPGAVYQLDDMWHDNFVTVGKNKTPARVIELGVLDLFSACRFKWGAKPRLKRDNGKFENLNEADARFFTAGIFHDVGYSPRGTMMMVEHGTAAIREDVERILYDATGGLIRFDRQPIEGKQQALLNYWGGTEGGNFRAKASLESTHNPIHNALSHLRGQTGKDKEHRPVTTDKQLAYITRTVKAVLKNCPEKLDLLKLPLLDFHTQFIPLLGDFYNHGLNARTDHDLEGWRELGHLVTEYTTLPGSDQWLSEQQLLKLPDSSQAIINENALAFPQDWTKKRYLSPREVWQPATSQLRKLPDYIVADILGPDLAREETVKGGYIRFNDQSSTQTEFIYEARVLTPHGAIQELPAGQKFQVFSNPFSPRWLMVHDAKGRYLGKCELYKRVNPLNLSAFADFNPWEERQGIRSPELSKAAGQKHKRIADIHADTRVRHEEEVQASQDMREHNRRLIAGEPLTETERRAAGAVEGKNTARRNRLENGDDEAEIVELSDLSAELPQASCETFEEEDEGVDLSDLY